MQRAVISFLYSTLCLVIFDCLLPKTARGQVTPDGTTATTVNQDGDNFTVEQGDRVGDNLFHSFNEFSVPTGGSAGFNNAGDTANIFSRVTGSSISSIDGLLSANGVANLYLINPNGIIFGENARLDLGGSFFASTADSLLFEGDAEFSAVNPQAAPLLEVSIPIGLNFRNNPGDITVRGNGQGVRTSGEIIDTQDALRVAEDATISLIGGELNFEDATVKTAGGRIEVGSVAGGRVNVVEVANGLSFDYSDVEVFQDISLSGTSSVIDASGNGGGDINIAGKNISINDSSGIEASTLGDEAGGEINVFATDSVEISGVENENGFISAIVNQVHANATADGGDINIETGSLSIGDRAGIFTDVSGRGDAGNININATDSVSLESQGNTSAIISSVNADGVGNAGDINITTSSIEFQGSGDIDRPNIGTGNSNESENKSSGNINIIANSSLTRNNGSLSTINSGRGNAGDISISATDNVSFYQLCYFSQMEHPGG